MGQSPQGCGCQHGRVQRLIVNGRHHARGPRLLFPMQGSFSFIKPHAKMPRTVSVSLPGYLPCFGPKGWRTSIRQEGAALRDFYPAYVGLGSLLPDQGARRCGRLLRKRRSARCDPSRNAKATLIGRLREGPPTAAQILKWPAQGRLIVWPRPA